MIIAILIALTVGPQPFGSITEATAIEALRLEVTKEETKS